MITMFGMYLFQRYLNKLEDYKFEILWEQKILRRQRIYWLLALVYYFVAVALITQILLWGNSSILLGFFVIIFTLIIYGGYFIRRLFIFIGANIDAVETAKTFGIDENSLKVMGGIILILMAISMVNGTTKEKTEEESKNNEGLAIIPIGIPIAFGTGLFTTIIIFKHQAQTATDLVSISLAFLINAFFMYLALRNSIYIKKYLGLTGQNIITKLMGLIVGAISVQFIVSGIIALSKIYLEL